MSKAKHLGMLCIWMMCISHAKGQSEPVSAKYEGYVYKPAKVEATDERIHFENNEPAKYEDFISGFLVEGGKQQFGRVVGLAQYTDGSLLVSDDENGIIYRISYQNN